MIILTTDTLHHRYLINRLLRANLLIEHIYFETKHTPTEPFYDLKRDQFERRFFYEVPYELPSYIPISEIVSVNDLNLKYTALGVVFGTSKIKPYIIDKFDTLLNIHRGISQCYRGLDSDLWAIYCEDFEQIGATIHLVEPTLDTGAIVKQDTIQLKSKMEIWQLRYYTTILSTDLIIEALSEPLQPRKQAKGKYFSAMPTDLKELTKNKFDQHVRRKCLI